MFDSYWIKRLAVNHTINVFGWRTRRKIVVFESDDWGMLRMHSLEALAYFEKLGFSVRNCIFNTNDCLETNDDLEALFDVLESVQDSKGNPCVLTANNVVANPDFDRIRGADFQAYFYEPFTTTLKRYSNRDRVLGLYEEGIRRKIFRPQFHAREHVNVDNWIRSLKRGDKTSLEAFNWHMYSVHAIGDRSSCKKEFLDSYGNPDEVEKYEEAIGEGLRLFRRIHQYHSRSFIAPCYTWSNKLNKTLLENGVEFLQGSLAQKIPHKNAKGFIKRYHYTGQRNKYGQVYLIRNAQFEVSENKDRDWVDSCLQQIALAFKYRKPAIVSVHRVCFMGGLNIHNRDHTLSKFRLLLKGIVTKWPTVEFMSTDQLGGLLVDQ